MKCTSKRTTCLCLIKEWDRRRRVQPCSTFFPHHQIRAEACSDANSPGARRSLLGETSWYSVTRFPGLQRVLAFSFHPCRLPRNKITLTHFNLQRQWATSHMRLAANCQAATVQGFAVCGYLHRCPGMWTVPCSTAHQGSMAFLPLLAFHHALHGH